MDKRNPSISGYKGHTVYSNHSLPPLKPLSGDEARDELEIDDLSMMETTPTLSEVEQEDSLCSEDRHRHSHHSKYGMTLEKGKDLVMQRRELSSNIGRRESSRSRAEREYSMGMENGKETAMQRRGSFSNIVRKESSRSGASPHDDVSRREFENSYELVMKRRGSASNIERKENLHSKASLNAHESESSMEMKNNKVLAIQRRGSLSNVGRRNTSSSRKTDHNYLEIESSSDEEQPVPLSTLKCSNKVRSKCTAKQAKEDVPPLDLHDRTYFSGPISVDKQSEYCSLKNTKGCTNLKSRTPNFPREQNLSPVKMCPKLKKDMFGSHRVPECETSAQLEKINLKNMIFFPSRSLTRLSVEEIYAPKNKKSPFRRSTTNLIPSKGEARSKISLTDKPKSGKSSRTSSIQKDQKDTVTEATNKNDEVMNAPKIMAPLIAKNIAEAKYGRSRRQLPSVGPKPFVAAGCGRGIPDLSVLPRPRIRRSPMRALFPLGRPSAELVYAEQEPVNETSNPEKPLNLKDLPILNHDLKPAIPGATLNIPINAPEEGIRTRRSTSEQRLKPADNKDRVAGKKTVKFNIPPGPTVRKSASLHNQPFNSRNNQLKSSLKNKGSATQLQTKPAQPRFSAEKMEKMLKPGVGDSGYGYRPYVTLRFAKEDNPYYEYERAKIIEYILMLEAQKMKQQEQKELEDLEGPTETQNVSSETNAVENDNCDDPTKETESTENVTNENEETDEIPRPETLAGQPCSKNHTVLGPNATVEDYYNAITHESESTLANEETVEIARPQTAARNPRILGPNATVEDYYNALPSESGFASFSTEENIPTNKVPKSAEILEGPQLIFSQMLSNNCKTDSNEEKVDEAQNIMRQMFTKQGRKNAENNDEIAVKSASPVDNAEAANMEETEKDETVSKVSINTSMNTGINRKSVLMSTTQNKAATSESGYTKASSETNIVQKKPTGPLPRTSRAPLRNKPDFPSRSDVKVAGSATKKVMPKRSTSSSSRTSGKSPVQRIKSISDLKNDEFATEEIKQQLEALEKMERKIQIQKEKMAINEAEIKQNNRPKFMSESMRQQYDALDELNKKIEAQKKKIASFDDKRNNKKGSKPINKLKPRGPLVASADVTQQKEEKIQKSEYSIESIIAEPEVVACVDIAKDSIDTQEITLEMPPAAEYITKLDDDALSTISEAVTESDCGSDNNRANMTVHQTESNRPVCSSSKSCEVDNSKEGDVSKSEKSGSSKTRDHSKKSRFSTKTGKNSCSHDSEGDNSKTEDISTSSSSKSGRQSVRKMNNKKEMKDASKSSVRSSSDSSYKSALHDLSSRDDDFSDALTNVSESGTFSLVTLMKDNVDKIKSNSRTVDFKEQPGTEDDMGTKQEPLQESTNPECQEVNEMKSNESSVSLESAPQESKISIDYMSEYMEVFDNIVERTAVHLKYGSAIKCTCDEKGDQPFCHKHINTKNLEYFEESIEVIDIYNSPEEDEKEYCTAEDLIRQFCPNFYVKHVLEKPHNLTEEFYSKNTASRNEVLKTFRSLLEEEDLLVSYSKSPLEIGARRNLPLSGEEEDFDLAIEFLIKEYPALFVLLIQEHEFLQLALDKLSVNENRKALIKKSKMSLEKLSRLNDKFEPN